MKQNLAWLATLLCGASTLLAAATNLTLIAVSDDPVPDGNGRFDDFLDPVINNAGQVAFSAILIATSGGGDDNFGIFRGDGTVLTQIARSGQPVPDGNGVFTGGIGGLDFFPQISQSGQVAFGSLLSDTIGGNLDNEGIFSGDGTTLIQIARTGQTIPDNSATIFPWDIYKSSPPINLTGMVAFWARLDDDVGIAGSQALFRSDGTNLVQISRQGQDAPDGESTYQFLDTFPKLNDNGEVAFIASNQDSNGLFEEWIFRIDGTNSPVVITRGGSDFLTSSHFYGVSINDTGMVAFSQSNFGDDDLSGIFRGDGNSVIRIAHKGQAAPDGNGVLNEISLLPAINGTGHVAFYAKLAGTSGGSSDDEGLFCGDGVTLAQIVRAGQPAPDGNGIFSSGSGFVYESVEINDRHQLLFVSKLAGTSGGNNDNEGIFLFDDNFGLLQVARKGDSFLGSTFTSLFISHGGNGDGLNNQGQVAFGFKLNDGRLGVAVWSAPSAPLEARLNSTYDRSLRALTISWPTALAGWVLETATDPVDPQSWEPLTTSPVTIGDQFQISIPTEGGQNFFRLRQQVLP